MSLVVNEVNTERFIDEIKLRPCLWDSASESYKDREQKKIKWIEICALFHPNFEDSTPKEKAEICKGLQGKWKNIRDCYRKYHKSLKTKSGQARNNVKTYVYAAQLSFLQTTVDLGPTEPSPNVEQGEDEFLGERDNMGTERPPSSSTIYRRKKNSLESKMEKYLDTFNASQAHAKEEDCDDLNFFKSVLPLVKSLPILDKIKFRMDVMKLALEYQQKNITAPTSLQTLSTSLQPLSTSMQPLPTSLQPLYVNPGPGESSTIVSTTPTIPGKAPRQSQMKRRVVSPSPTAFGVMQSAWKRLRDDEGDSSELDSPGTNSICSFMESENYFSEGDFN